MCIYEGPTEADQRSLTACQYTVFTTTEIILNYLICNYKVMLKNKPGDILFAVTCQDQKITMLLFPDF